MAGRALVFSNPEVIRTLQSEFVAYAGDQWYLHRRQDEDGRFFWKVAQQGYRRDAPLDETRQGLYIATADGELLASDAFHPDPQRLLTMLREALARWKDQPQTAAVPIDAAAPDPSFVRQPPAGGLTLNVYSRIPLKPANGQWTPNQATGRDHLWLTAAEWRSLLPQQWRKGFRFAVPPAVAERLIRFHLVDNVRGEPDMWTRSDIEESQMFLRVEDAAAGRLQLEGTARMRHAEQRGYEARLQGYLTYDSKQDRFTRFDLLAWGSAWGAGTYTGGAPPGRFPLVIAASLAGDTPADHIPPQGSRSWQNYFGN